MKITKRIFTGMTALALLGTFTACGESESSNNNTNTPGQASPETTTTTGITVAVNTEPLSEEDAAVMGDIADSLTGELENKTIKWFSFYDPYHANNLGQKKALSLELFEAKYGGEIEYVQTTWESRFNDMSTRIIGGDGIDFTPGGDLDSFPKGVPNGQFESFDSYIDWNDPLWAEWKDLNDMFELNGSHYLICLNATGGQVVYYNRDTIEYFGFDDPAELLEAGEWTWDKFREMLMEYCDVENEQYGLDGWFNEQPIMLTAGVPSVELKGGKLVSNVMDPNLERVMNFMHDLNTFGLVLDKNLTGWTVHNEFIGEGKELFYISGLYEIQSAPEIWSKTFGEVGNAMFVPLPKDPQADKYYLPAGLEAYMLCKGAQNPEGVMRFMECTLAANSDERTKTMNIDNMKNNYGWTDEMIEMNDKINQLTIENPVYDLHAGCPTDLYDILDSGDYGIRAAFYGVEWSTVRDELNNVVNVYIDEFNSQL